MIIEGWIPVPDVFEMERCEVCEEALCDIHLMHYYECECIGQHEEDYEYKEENGILYARKIV